MIGVAPDKVYASDELALRPSKGADYRRQTEAIADLAAHLKDDTPSLLGRFVALAQELTGGSSAGLSLLDAAADPAVFIWCNLHGVLSVFEGATTPLDHSPCGVTLDRSAPTLAVHPERAYNWIAETGVPIPEVLLVPLHSDGEPLGTLWVVAQATGHFDAEDARILSELADFIGIGLSVLERREVLRRALEEQELLTREMNHRVKNLFAMSTGMIRVSAAKAGSAQELAGLLAGRFGALARAHDLVRRHDPRSASEAATADLAELIRTIVSSAVGGRERFSLSGPDVLCGQHAVISLALVIHELATNAVKYGALSLPQGHVTISWALEDGNIVLKWIETGGPPIESLPTRQGFGTILIDRTITSRFRGTASHDWRREGLAARFTLAADSIES